MNTVKIENCNTLFIGRRGENEVTEVVFDFTEWQEQFGTGVIDLYVKRSVDFDAYPVVLWIDGTVATWIVTDADTAVVGSGKIEFVYTVNEKVAKSAVFPFYVGEDIGQASSEPPDPYESWIETLTELGTETQANAQAAAQSASDAADSAASASESAVQAEDSAEDAEAWAVGERDGEPVSEGEPTYENNAKYWAENARANAPVQSVNGKDGNVELTLDDIPNGETFARGTPEQLAQIGKNADDIADIDAMIPSITSETNHLVNVSFLTNRLKSYRTSAAQDTIDAGKQEKITAYGILKRDRSGNITGAVAGADYVTADALNSYRKATAQDAIDNAQNQNIDKNTAAINTMQPAATAADIGKALIVKTVADGKPTSYEYGEAGGGGSVPTAGDGIEISNDVISNTQGIEYIVGTQAAATSKWTGVSTDETLKVGKIIAYYLPYAGASTAATLALTMADGTTTREISLQLKPNATVTTQFPAGSIIILVYDGSYWRVNASYDTDTNTYPTGYCLTNGSVAAKSATCSFGYRGDTNYFPCLFRFANTATDATLAITTYAPEAAPIYVNGARTSATNTFSAGVILFLYYNGAYYCYNDGRFPILVDGAVTSVQEYAAGLLADYRTAAAQDTIDAGKQAKITASGILKGDGAGGVSAAVAGTDYLAPSALEPYRTAADQDLIDSEQDERLDAVEQTTTATTIGPVALATFDASAADMPLKGLTVDIEPVQSGEGDPSPENIRPIAGWTGAKVFYPGLDITLDLDIVKNKYINTSGVETGAASTDLSHTDFFPVTPGATLYLSTYWDKLPDSALSIAFYDVNKTFRTPRKYFFSDSAHKGAIGYNFVTVTVPSNCYYAIFNFNYGVRDRIVLTDKDPTISFPSPDPGTVYGGTLDVVNRKLNSYPYYSSYNGETIIGPWISSMDVYTPGATPTLGAQVVDMGGAATSYDLSDVPEITTLFGENNIWANRGDVTVTYGAYLETIKIYADQAADSAAAAAEAVLASIRSDYTELSEDVDDLKSAKANAATSVVGGTTLLIRDAMEDSALKTLNIDIVPAQQGSGNPTPSNIRPLTGTASLTLTVDNETNGNNAYTYDISATIGGVMWGGHINAVTGALEVTYYGFEAQDKRWTASSTAGRFFFNPVQNGMPRSHDKPASYCYCSHLTRVDSLPSVGNRIFVNAPTQIAVTMEGITSLDAFNAYLTAQKNNGTPVQIIYKLESPLEYTLDSSNIILHSGATTITNNISAIMEAEYYIDLASLITHPRRGAYSPNDISVQYDISGGYYDKGILKLPLNYNTLGDAVPLIVFVHGSADYGSINSTTMSANYETYLNFLRDCGYAVFDCYGWGSKYTSTTAGYAQTWGLPINRDCYISGVNYVCDKYNIDRNNIFVASKSLGGLQALSFFYDSGFPVKAVGMLAPELSIFKPRLGYDAATKKTVAAELGFSEDTGGVLNFDGDNAPEGFWEYITSNMDKWCGVFSIFDGLPIKTEDKPSYYLNIQGTSNMCRTSLNRPLKIWIAEDDGNVSYPMATAFVKSLNNGGYNGILRTMPSGTGAHHAVDSDPNALQTTDVTTKCGVHYDTIPTAYYELAKWFDMWLTN